MPVQVKVRELVAKVLLASVAAERGYGVVLGTHRRLRPSLHRLPPGIVWDYGAAYPLLRLFDRYRAAGHRVVACEEEGLVEVPHDAVVGTDLYVAWGEEEAARVIAARPTTAEKIRITGHPRFDLLRPELRKLHAPAIDEIVGRLGRYLLVNTNFPVNVQFGVSVLQQTYKFDKEGFTDEDMDWFVQRDRHSARIFEAFKAMIVTMARAFPRHRVVLRPHPSERDETWVEVARAAPNIHVERTGSVVPWVMGADALVHNSCTTGIEAHMVGSAVISFRPVEDSRFDWELPNEVSTQVRDLDALLAELDAAVKAADRGDRRQPAGLGVLRRHVAATDGPLASERIVDAFDEVRPSAQRLPAGPVAGALARRDYSIITAKHLTKYVLRMTRIPLKFEATKNPGWDAAEVNDVIGALGRTTGRFGEVRAHDLWPHVVAIVKG